MFDSEGGVFDTLVVPVACVFALKSLRFMSWFSEQGMEALPGTLQQIAETCGR